MILYLLPFRIVGLSFCNQLINNLNLMMELDIYIIIEDINFYLFLQ
jgi:hypothetical protein